jgi:hypothetical protein
MEISYPLYAGLSVKIATQPSGGTGYPTTRLQKGLLLIHDGQEMVEEGVGFGVPVLKQGLRTIYAGDIELIGRQIDSIHELTAHYIMNLEEKVARQGWGSVENKMIYTIKNSLAAMIRRFPSWRGLLTSLSNILRWLLKWETTYEETGFCSKVIVTYTIDREAGKITVEVDTAGLPRDSISEVAVMNEQGACHFDQYQDSAGTYLRGKEIGCWDEVTAEEASFIDAARRVGFSLSQVKGAKLFRGREHIGSRLAWSGFGYLIPPTIERFSYALKIEKLP